MTDTAKAAPVVAITLGESGRDSTVVVNDQDITRLIRGVRVSTEAGHLTRVELELLPTAARVTVRGVIARANLIVEGGYDVAFGGLRLTLAAPPTATIREYQPPREVNGEVLGPVLGSWSVAMLCRADQGVFGILSAYRNGMDTFELEFPHAGRQRRGRAWATEVGMAGDAMAVVFQGTGPLD